MTRSTELHLKFGIVGSKRGGGFISSRELCRVVGCRIDVGCPEVAVFSLSAQAALSAQPTELHQGIRISRVEIQSPLESGCCLGISALPDIALGYVGQHLDGIGLLIGKGEELSESNLDIEV